MPEMLALSDSGAAKPGNVSPDACKTSPHDERLGTSGVVKPAYIASFKAVERYRATHSWPLGAVSTNPAQVDVVAAAYGPYVIISLANNFPLRDSSGNLALGCGGVEYYRVQTATSEVLPFDGCVESHRAVLPRLSQLPQWHR